MAANPDPGSLNEPDGLEIVVRREGTTTTIEVHGEWDLAGQPSIRQAISGVMDDGPECIVLDLSQVGFMDSTGVHAVIELTKRSAAQNTRLVIIPGPGPVQRMFEITGLLEQLPFIEKPSNGSRVARRHDAQSGNVGSGAFSLPASGAGRLHQTAGAAPRSAAPRRASGPCPVCQTAAKAGRRRPTMTSSVVRDFVAPAGSLPAAGAAAARSPTTDGWPRALRRARRPTRAVPAPSRAGLASRIGGPPNTVSLLEVDPDLGCGIESHDWEAARRATRATLTRIDRRECMLPAGACETGNIVGLIVNDGMVSREIALGEHVAFELLTPGDVLLPAAAEPDDLDLGARVTLTALDPTELIVLSKPFIHAAARWPSLLTNLHRRLEAQRQRLASYGLAAHLPRAEDRLLLTLWTLAHRCGRVTPEGTVLPLWLSHEVLGRLAAARRPTITLALRTLVRTECVQRGPNGYLTLGPAAHQRVQELTQASISRPPIGPSVALHPPSN